MKQFVDQYMNTICFEVAFLPICNVDKIATFTNNFYNNFEKQPEKCGFF